MYLVLILNLMRGVVTEKRFGFMPNLVINWFLSPVRVKKNLKNPAMTYFALFFVEIYDNLRENVMKPVYRSLPIGFKVWYDKIRYKV